MLNSNLAYNSKEYSWNLPEWSYLVDEVSKVFRLTHSEKEINSCSQQSTIVFLSQKFPIIKQPSRRTILSQPRKNEKGVLDMKGITTQQGRETLNKFKMEAANEVGVNLKQGYNGDLTSREAGSVGGQMVKKMIDAYKSGSQH